MLCQITESANSKLLHPELECRAIQAQACCGTLRPRQYPLGLLQSRKNLSAFDFFQSLLSYAGVARHGPGAKVTERHSQDRARRENHCPFDHILQLTDISTAAIAE